MNSKTEVDRKAEEKADRALRFAARLRDAQIGPASLTRETGLGRSLIYHLSKGQAPKPEDAKKIDEALERLRKAPST